MSVRLVRVMHKSDGKPVRRDLGCPVIRLEYSFEKRQGNLYIDAGNCVDMSAAIHLFEGIDPDVISIGIVTGVIPYIGYFRMYTGDDWNSEDGMPVY